MKKIMLLLNLILIVMFACCGLAEKPPKLIVKDAIGNPAKEGVDWEFCDLDYPYEEDELLIHASGLTVSNLGTVEKPEAIAIVLDNDVKELTLNNVYVRVGDCSALYFPCQTSAQTVTLNNSIIASNSDSVVVEHNYSDATLTIRGKGSKIIGNNGIYFWAGSSNEYALNIESDDLTVIGEDKAIFCGYYSNNPVAVDNFTVNIVRTNSPILTEVSNHADGSNAELVGVFTETSGDVFPKIKGKKFLRTYLVSPSDDIPQTGDNSDVVLWSTLLLSCGVYVLKCRKTNFI